MIKLISNILILYFLVIFNYALAKEEVLFTINNNPVTSIDLNNRVIYISIFNNFDYNNVNKEHYLDDLIATRLFDEFVKIKEFKIEAKEIDFTWDSVYSNNKNKIDQLINSKDITKKIILKNIEYDLQRKKTLESLLKRKINSINLDKSSNNLIDIYNISIIYFIIDNKYKKSVKNNHKYLLDKDIQTFKEKLNKENIEYQYNKKNIMDLDQINNDLKEIILNNKNDFFISNDNYFIIGLIEKKLKKN